MAPKIQTVLGEVDPGLLGITLTHEHLTMDFSHFYRKPPTSIAKHFDNALTLNNIGYIRQYPYSHRNNLSLNDAISNDAVYNDIKEYKLCGGGAIAENSTHGLERNIDFLVEVAKGTDVNIIAGTGFYIEDTQPSDVVSYFKEELYNHMMKELTEHCKDYPLVKAGFIGEVASVWPIRDFERKAIIAAGEVQEQVGCGVSFHPHRHPDAPFEIIRLYLEAGGKADKAVMSHLDRTLLDPEKLLSFSEFCTYCQFDLFGIEVSYYQLNAQTDMPSDAQRIEMIRQLVEEGKVDRVLMSHDIHTKHRLTDFGGHGYSHILTNVLPRMKSKGFIQAQLDQITISNPATWLTIH